jgi:transposase
MSDKICFGHRFFLLDVCRRTYILEFTMAFFKHQIDNMKMLRPHAKWGILYPWEKLGRKEAHQMNYIAFDCHKRYTFASVENESGKVLQESRIEHQRGAITEFLKQCQPGSPVAIETVGNWYWIVDEVEAAGMSPRLVHARKAKLMLAMVNKTDKLDCHGLNRLQRIGTLPSVWIPPGELRDMRDLPRTRMVLSRQRTRLKNRIHATLAKYGLSVEGVSDAFGKRGREQIQQKLVYTPPHTRFGIEQLFAQLELIEQQIELFENRMRNIFTSCRELELLQTLPGVGFILATVILLEIGDIDRFPSAPQLAAYVGTTPRVYSSGDKTRYGKVRPDVNRYLKWAYIEAGNAVCRTQRFHLYAHTTQLYMRIRQRKGHQKAVGAVARHLAEATYWILKKGEPYQDPSQKQGFVHGGVSAVVR